MNSGGGGEADQARNDENERQAQIRRGTNRINQIFDGVTGVAGPAATTYDPTKTYYTADGNTYSPSTDDGHGLGNGNPFGTADPNQFAAGRVAQGKLFSDRTTSGGFDDTFYNGRKQAYLDYANPQLEKQRGDAAKQLTFSLARSGLLNSSARAQQEGSLADLYGQQSKAIGQQATQQETDSRNAVEGARSDLITMLNATGDADSAANSAIARSQALSATPAYSPLGDLFSSFTNTLGTQAAQERASALSGGYYQPAINTGLFGVNGVTKVTH